MSLDDFADLMSNTDGTGMPDDQVLIETLSEDHERLRRVVSGLKDKIPPSLIKELSRPVLVHRDRGTRLRDQGYAMAYRMLRLNGVHKYYVDHVDPSASEPRQMARDMSLALDRALDFLNQIGYDNPTDRLNALSKLLKLLSVDLRDHFPKGGHTAALRRYNQFAIATFAQFRRVLEKRGIRSPYEYTIALNPEA